MNGRRNATQFKVGSEMVGIHLNLPDFPVFPLLICKFSTWATDGCDVGAPHALDQGASSLYATQQSLGQTTVRAGTSGHEPL